MNNRHISEYYNRACVCFAACLTLHSSAPRIPKILWTWSAFRLRSAGQVNFPALFTPAPEHILLPVYVNTPKESLIGYFTALC